MPVVLVSTKYELHILVMIALELLGFTIKFVLIQIPHFHIDLHPIPSLGTRAKDANLVDKVLRNALPRICVRYANRPREFLLYIY